MNEHSLQLIASTKIVWLAVFSYLYGLGGISNKWIRRFIAPCWMMAGIFIYSTMANSWHYWYLLCLPIMIIGLHNGYGADKLWDKIRRRATYGLILSMASIPLVIFSGLYILYFLSAFWCILSSVVLGAFDAPKNARDNETLMATCCFLFMLFLI